MAKNSLFLLWLILANLYSNYGFFPIDDSWQKPPQAEPLTPSYSEADDDERDSYVLASRLYGLLTGDLIKSPGRYGQASLLHCHITASGCENREEGVEIFFINGANNSSKEAIETAELLSAIFGKPIDLLYNVSYTPTEDLIRAIQVAKGRCLSEQIYRVSDLFQRLASEETTSYIYWIAHSEGALITQKALELLEEPDLANLYPKLTLYTFGGAAPVDPLYGEHVHNMISEKDPFPAFFEGVSESWNSALIETLPSKSYFFEHSIRCTTYREQIEEIAKTLDLLLRRR